MDIYDYLKVVNKNYFPQWRAGQLITNFQEWLLHNKKITDLFYIEDYTLIKYIEEFVALMK